MRMRFGTLLAIISPLRLPLLLLLLLAACGDRGQVVLQDDAGVTDAAVDRVIVMRDFLVLDFYVGPCGMPCEDPTPFCDPQSHKCVPCLADKDCPDQQICRLKQCRPGCSAIHAACGDAGACDVDMGVCRGCINDKECSKNLRFPACDTRNGQCVVCTLASDKCPQGSYCVADSDVYSCTQGCKSDDECRLQGGQGKACCNHVCTDITASAESCGGCGMSCNGRTCCSAKCVDTGADVANCGQCGKACPVQNNTPACSNGVCMPGPCSKGYAHCTMNPGDVCETTISSDPKNCGSCGKVCAAPNATPICFDGTCSIGSCVQGWRDCDADVQNGCEVNVSFDPQNCGLCGQRCVPLPHATIACSNGSCAVINCTQGFGNCDFQSGNGCEADLTSDVKNCGFCGIPCLSPPNVTVACTAGVCAYGPCANGFANCNNNLKTGCTVVLATDVSNCGACGNICPALANASIACVSSKCGIKQCNAGYADCDMAQNNGCEINLATDTNNCGTCGKVCPQGWTCSASACTPPFSPVGKVGNLTYYKVPVVGAMTDTNVYNTCKANGLGVGCAAMGNCMYNDNLCVVSQEPKCLQPMTQLAIVACGQGNTPATCNTLARTYQYMGHLWTADSACGVEGITYCAQGSLFANGFALCAL